MFNSLRDWRTRTARKDGVPPYVICTNRQLAELAKMRPESAAGLMKIEGIGRNKAAKYGEEIVRIVSATAQAASSGHTAQTGEDLAKGPTEAKPPDESKQT